MVRGARVGLDAQGGGSRRSRATSVTPFVPVLLSRALWEVCFGLGVLDGGTPRLLEGRLWGGAGLVIESRGGIQVTDFSGSILDNESARLCFPESYCTVPTRTTSLNVTFMLKYFCIMI